METIHLSSFMVSFFNWCIVKSCRGVYSAPLHEGFAVYPCILIDTHMNLSITPFGREIAYAKFACPPQSQTALQRLPSSITYSTPLIQLLESIHSTHENVYAYVAGFQGTIVSKLHKCSLLAQCFNLPQKPAIISYTMLCVLIIIYFEHFNSNIFNIKINIHFLF